MNKIIILIIILIVGYGLYFVFCKEKVEAPSTEESVEEPSSGLTVPLTGVKVNDAICAPFLAFPDCSYAAEKHQDLCKKCREK